MRCKKHSLKEEAEAHLARVIRLDPRREAASKRLGFRKHNGRWLTEERAAEVAVQEKATRRRAHEPSGWHKPVHGRSRHAEAERALAAIEDPRAVPAVMREFGSGGVTDQALAVRPRPDRQPTVGRGARDPGGLWPFGPASFWPTPDRKLDHPDDSG